MRGTLKVRTLFLALVLASLALGVAQTTGSIPGLSLTTLDHVQGPSWWPTKGTPPANAYTGEAACMKCHAGIVATQHTTPMYHAGVRAENTIPLLAQQPDMTFHEGPYTYTIRDNTFSVNNGAATSTQPITWTFGNGENGQT